ncbi:hypothetical protein SDC9_212541 [bioreactor metagenome]|uniref:Uncharacterized protein n=1 Tax=bioreactor metagenome TaxID=1076179 RepID=A0A645JZD7_9ZZZZ
MIGGRSPLFGKIGHQRPNGNGADLADSPAVFVHGVPGKVEPGHFLLHGDELPAGKLGKLQVDPHHGRSGALPVAAEEIELAFQILFPSADDLVHQGFIGVQKLRAAVSHAVKSAAPD